MFALGHRHKLRFSGGRIHYGGLTWTSDAVGAHGAKRVSTADVSATAATLHFA